MHYVHRVTETLRQVIGAKVRGLRAEHGRRQDDVARAARELGLSWSRSKVAELERGDKALPVEELVLLPLVLARARCGQPSLLELLPTEGDSSVRLGARVAMPATELGKVVTGNAKDVHYLQVETPHTRSVRAAFAEVREQMRQLAAISGGELSVAQFEAAERDERLDGEQVASRRLKVPAIAVSVAAHHTWSQGLTQERDARVADRVKPDANPRTVQAARGHVTRELYRELEPALDRYRQAEQDQEI